MLRFKASNTTTLSQCVIAGKVLEIGVPIERRVRVYSRACGQLLATTKSNTNGSYKVYLPRDTAYQIISIDTHKNFNAVIQDNVVPK